jgi:hypothetical protein
MDPSLLERATEYAYEAGYSLSGLVEVLLRQRLEAKELAQSIRDGSYEEDQSKRIKAIEKVLKVIEGDPNGPPGAHGPGKRARNAGSGGVA